MVPTTNLRRDGRSRRRTNLPPYRSDFNPIASASQKLRAILPAARYRLVETLWLLLGECLARLDAGGHPCGGDRQQAAA